MGSFRIGLSAQNCHSVPGPKMLRNSTLSMPKLRHITLIKILRYITRCVPKCLQPLPPSNKCEWGFGSDCNKHLLNKSCAFVFRVSSYQVLPLSNVKNLTTYKYWTERGQTSTRMVWEGYQYKMQSTNHQVQSSGLLYHEADWFKKTYRFWLVVHVLYHKSI